MSRLARASTNDLAPLAALLDPAYPDVLARIAESLYLTLRDEAAGDAADHARLALALTESLRAEFGGAQLYLPKGVGYDLSERDRRILSAFNGHNHRELAHRHNVTDRYIYDIVARRTREEFERRQGRLPGLDAAE